MELKVSNTQPKWMRYGRSFMIMALLMGMSHIAFGQDVEEVVEVDYATYGIDNLLLLVSAALVFWMHAGFAMLEAGLTRSKNVTNILAKNVGVVAISGLTYFICGFNLMYPGDFNGIVGFAGFGFGTVSEPGYAAYSLFTDFIFQAVFAATGATIVSGAVAERIKFSSFLVFTTIFVTFIYTIAGSWHWGGGWLATFGPEIDGEHPKGFYDFAGSTLVHSVGGWAALTGAIILGPRLGKYTSEGIRPVVGHSMPLATIGVFILFMGWFGFNGGSVLAMDSDTVSIVYVTTFLAGCAGGVAAMITAWTVLRKPDLTMMLNGLLAGLVGITAGADSISPWMSIVVGAIAGVIVVFSVVMLDKIKIDDPVGAISVHLVCGIWGTLAVGLFGGKAIVTQVIGIVAYGAFTVITSAILWIAIKAIMGLRVSEEEETNGLDVAEHGLEAYPEFRSTSGII